MRKILSMIFPWVCAHDNTTFPQSPLAKKMPALAALYQAQPACSDATVTCLDCGKKAAYDWARMKPVW